MAGWRRRVVHDPIVRRIAMILDAGQPTRFAFEGACLHGVRSQMCLAGSTWHRAHEYARMVVTLALHRIGSSMRPTWREGQPEWRELTRWHCATCGGELDDERTKYCCDECRIIGVNRDVHIRRQLDTEAARAAMQAAAGGALPTRECASCHKVFEIEPARPLKKYCSRDCFMAARAATAKTCPQCGHLFVPRDRAKKFCSIECRDESYRRPRQLAAAA